jgi:hypothetical protein
VRRRVGFGWERASGKDVGTCPSWNVNCLILDVSVLMGGEDVKDASLGSAESYHALSSVRPQENTYGPCAQATSPPCRRRHASISKPTACGPGSTKTMVASTRLPAASSDVRATEEGR